MTTRELVTIASEALSADIDPLGAQLFALRDAEGRDLQWDGDPQVWAGRAPILFPIVGMLAGGQYQVDGTTYHMAKHGFARHKRFAVVEADSKRAQFRLRADDETLAVYPFKFELDLQFIITGATLTLAAGIRNLGDKSMPASLGFHPALRWPLPYGQQREAHLIEFETDEPAPIRRIDSDGLLKPEALPTPVRGRKLALNDALFRDDALIFDRLKSRKLSYRAEEGPRVEVGFEDTPFLGIWTKPGAGFICVEPWHGIADPEGYDGEFRNKPGVVEVAAGATFEVAMSLTLRL